MQGIETLGWMLRLCCLQGCFVNCCNEANFSVHLQSICCAHLYTTPSRQLLRANAGRLETKWLWRPLDRMICRSYHSSQFWNVLRLADLTQLSRSRLPCYPRQPDSCALCKLLDDSGRFPFPVPGGWLMAVMDGTRCHGVRRGGTGDVCCVLV